MKPVTPEVTGYLQQLSGKYDIHLTGSYVRGEATSTSDIDIIVSVSDEVFNEPMSSKMKEIEEAIWEQVPQADVFFSKMDRSEVIVIPAFMRGGEVNAKQIWKGAKRISEVAIPKAEAGRAAKPSLSKFELYNTQHSLKQLQEIAKTAGLSPSGLKLDLLNRLIQKGVLK